VVSFPPLPPPPLCCFSPLCFSPLFLFFSLSFFLLFPCVFFGFFFSESLGFFFFFFVELGVAIKGNYDALRSDAFSPPRHCYCCLFIQLMTLSSYIIMPVVLLPLLLTSLYKKRHPRVMRHFQFLVFT